MTTSQIAIYICSILSFVPAIVLHEVAHGFAAYKLGDQTAKSMGRLSLNPLKHIDPFGTVILPLALMILNMPVFGFAKPVPYNPHNFKNKQLGDFIVGMAGPLANLAQALLGSAIMYALSATSIVAVRYDFFFYFYYYFLPQFILINLYLMFFNLIPIPPLDGSSIIALFIPTKHLGRWYSIQTYAMPILMIVLIVFPYIFNVSPFSWYLNVTAYNLGTLLIPGLS